MFGSDKDGLAVIKTLTDTLADSVNGYREAANQVESDEFRQMFTELGDDRVKALDALEAELVRLGGRADRDGTALGTLHQRWMDFKANITGSDDKSVINEVERGEDYLKDKFETAMSSDALQGTGRAVVEQAFSSVRQGHDRVRDLKRSLEGHSSS